MSVHLRFRLLLVLLLLAPTVSPNALAQSADGAPRNIVFILSDDHRYDFMGFHPGAPEFLETPAMDRMAREGMHIANAFVSTSLCSPSRATILTGQYAHNHGVVDNQRAVPEGTRFFAEDLREAGYETAFVGKWHMGHDYDDPRPGFDHWVSFRGQGPYFDPLLNVNGEHRQFQGYTTDILTDRAIEWLRGRSGDEPFFLYLSHKSIHGLYDPAPRHVGRYANEEIPYPETMANIEENYRGRPRWVEEQRYSWHGVEHMYHRGIEDFDELFLKYNEALYSLDENVGRVLDYLDESGLADETLVIYMGDNGHMWGEHGLIDKRQMYEESMRVPMLVWSPGFVEPGSTLEGLVQNIDVAPTILELAGVEMPDRMDGRSFLPLLAGADVPWRDEVIYEYYWEWNYPHTPTMFGIRGDRYKYVFYYGLWDHNEFYDLQTDPKERHNLIGAPEHQERIMAMRERLFDILEETGGMHIPLRRPRNDQQGERLLH